jgi:hypothetical protein
VRSALKASRADECASEAQQRAVLSGLAFPADPEPAEVGQPRERPLHNPPDASESRATLGGAPRDHRLHAAAPQLAAVFVMVVAAIGNHPVRALARPAAAAPRWRRFHRRAAAVASRHCDFRRSERRPAARREGRRSGDVWNQCGRSTGDLPVSGPPRSARIWLPSTTPTGQSSRPLSRVRSSRCSRAQPAACQSRSRRHAVTPEQPIAPGTNRHGMPVRSTKRIAVKATRSSTRGRPIRRAGRSGNSGSDTTQSPSPTSSESAMRHPASTLTTLSNRAAGTTSVPARDDF